MGGRPVSPSVRKPWVRRCPAGHASITEQAGVWKCDCGREGFEPVHASEFSTKPAYY